MGGQCVTVCCCPGGTWPMVRRLAVEVGGGGGAAKVT